MKRRAKASSRPAAGRMVRPLKREGRRQQRGRQVFLTRTAYSNRELPPVGRSPYMADMRAIAGKRRKGGSGNRAVAALAIIAILLTVFSGPATNSAMAEPPHEQSAMAAHHAETGAGPCCDGCGETETQGCPYADLCMAACGKLQAQAANWVMTKAAPAAEPRVPFDAETHAGLSLPPPRKPPRLI